MRGIPSLDFRSGLGESMAKRQRTGQQLSPIAAGHQSPDPPPSSSQGVHGCRRPLALQYMLGSRLRDLLPCIVLLASSCEYHAGTRLIPSRFSAPTTSGTPTGGST